MPIEAYAAAGPLEFSENEIARDHTVEDPVYRRLRFDLCANGHRQFLDNPLAR